MFDQIWWSREATFIFIQSRAIIILSLLIKGFHSCVSHDHGRSLSNHLVLFYQTQSHLRNCYIVMSYTFTSIRYSSLSDIIIKCNIWCKYLCMITHVFEWNRIYLQLFLVSCVTAIEVSYRLQGFISAKLFNFIVWLKL